MREGVAISVAITVTPSFQASKPVSAIIRRMSTQFDEIERQARLLPLNEKATLARVLIEELDASIDTDAEQLWLVEAQRRYHAYLKGELPALPGEEVMARARDRIK
jgi:hypothetical protein